MSQTCQDVMVVLKIQALENIPQLDTTLATPEVQGDANQDLLACRVRSHIAKQFLGGLSQARSILLKNKLQALGMILESEIQDFLHPALMPACSLPIQHNGPF